MDMTLDYNKELFPLAEGQTIAMALASSLSRHVGPVTGAEGVDADDKDRDVWRPDGKGKEGLQDDYDYVMYGKVCFLSRTHHIGRCRHTFRFTSSMGEQPR